MPIKLLIKVPVPDPSIVLKSEIVGFILELQQTPFAVIDDPPSSAITPPLVAVVVLIWVTELVIIDATPFFVVKYC
jgi:hypothetical protein